MPATVEPPVSERTGLKALEGFVLGRLAVGDRSFRNLAAREFTGQEWRVSHGVVEIIPRKPASVRELLGYPVCRNSGRVPTI
jgi:hypothetical protein